MKALIFGFEEKECSFKPLNSETPIVGYRVCLGYPKKGYKGYVAPNNPNSKSRDAVKFISKSKLEEIQLKELMMVDVQFNEYGKIESIKRLS